MLTRDDTQRRLSVLLLRPWLWIRDYVEVVTTPSGATRYQMRIEAGKAVGKRQQQKRRFTNLQDAIDAYNAGRGDRSRGVQVSPSGVTLREAADGYLGVLSSSRPNTITSYAAVLRPAIARLGDRPVQEIRREEFEKLVSTSPPRRCRRGTGARPAVSRAAPADRRAGCEQEPVGRRRSRYRPPLREMRPPPPKSDDAARPPPSDTGPTRSVSCWWRKHLPMPTTGTSTSATSRRRTHCSGRVAQVILPNCEPTLSNKASFLVQLRDRGVFLIDLKPDPVDGSPLAPYVPALLARIAELAPERIILIKAGVFDAAARAGGRRPPRQQCADPVPVVGAAEGVRRRVRSGARCGVIPTSITRG